MKRIEVVSNAQVKIGIRHVVGMMVGQPASSLAKKKRRRCHVKNGNPSRADASSIMYWHREDDMGLRHNDVSTVQCNKCHSHPTHGLTTQNETFHSL